MNLSEAWKTLGFSLNRIMLEMRKIKYEKRPQALENAFKKAKVQAKKLMAQHHPDRGGKFEDFHKVKQAIDSIESHTREYVNNPPVLKLNLNKIHIEINK